MASEIKLHHLFPGHAGLISLRQLHHHAQSVAARHDGRLVDGVSPGRLKRLSNTHQGKEPTGEADK